MTTNDRAEKDIHITNRAPSDHEVTWEEFPGRRSFVDLMAYAIADARRAWRLAGFAALVAIGTCLVLATLGAVAHSTNIKIQLSLETVHALYSGAAVTTVIASLGAGGVHWARRRTAAKEASAPARPHGDTQGIPRQ